MRTSTREHILDTAAHMVEDDPDSRLSVRTVANRAGVGVGTLRHHFPTQRELVDAVLARVYERAMPDDRIHDEAVPPRDRLVQNLARMIDGVGTGDDARRAWSDIHSTFIALSADEGTRSSYSLLHAGASRRIESWLATLVGQGALPAGDNTRRAEFLLAVVDGLSLHRALPTQESVRRAERDVLSMAVQSLLVDPA